MTLILKERGFSLILKKSAKIRATEHPRHPRPFSGEAKKMILTYELHRLIALKPEAVVDALSH
jgi:hypothetical protein